MENLTIEEIETLEDLLKTEVMETKMAMSDVDDDDKEELKEYLETLKSIQSKLFSKK